MKIKPIPQKQLNSLWKEATQSKRTVLEKKLGRLFKTLVSSLNNDWWSK